MASSLRLTFLYPHLFKSVRVNESTAKIASRRLKRFKNEPAFSTCCRDQERFTQRHGKAVEPFLPEGVLSEDVKVFAREAKNATDTTNSPRSTTTKKAKSTPKEPSSSAPLSKETQNAAVIPGDDNYVLPDNVSPDLTPLQQAADNTSSKDNPLGEVLLVEPGSGPPKDPDIPHLSTPPYVHHFDSYTLVKQIEDGGFTNAQAVTSMKIIRGLLAQNLEVAKEGLVGASDVENETYLFRAACSELRTELQNTRRASDEKTRRERTLLQHEVDTLNLKLTQELLILKDDLRGMFNDRKLLVREEQRSMESKIQEINYKITVSLNSDAKSEVEGLRWILTRRSVLGILFMAFMVLSSLRFASYQAHQRELEAKKIEKARAEARKNGMRYVDSGVQGDVPITAAEALAAN